VFDLELTAERMSQCLDSGRNRSADVRMRAFLTRLDGKQDF